MEIFILHGIGFPAIVVPAPPKVTSFGAPPKVTSFGAPPKVTSFGARWNNGGGEFWKTQ